MKTGIKTGCKYPQGLYKSCINGGIGIALLPS